MKRLRDFLAAGVPYATPLEVWARCAQARALRADLLPRVGAWTPAAEHNDRLEALRRRGWATVSCLATTPRAAA
ncbi:MAG: hypothetical protein QM691_13745 [Opitutaceae bacterium]